jgi:hypothetical protein
MERRGYRPIVLAKGGVADVLQRLLPSIVTRPPAG